MLENKKKEIIELDKRRKIYDFVSKNPGIHLREISRKLDIPKTTLKYHLNYLKRKNLLISKTDSKYNRYFAQSDLGTIDKKFITVLRKDISRGIIILSFIYDEIYINELSAGLDTPFTTISYHLKKLKDLGILDSKQKKGRAVYYLKDRNYIYNFLIKFKDNLIDDSLLSDFIYYLKVEMPNGKSKKNLHKKDRNLDKAYNAFIEFFPIPFCA